MINRPLHNWASVVDEARKYGPARVVVAAGNDAEALKAAVECESLGLATFILVGDREKMVATAESVGYPAKPNQLIHEPDLTAASRIAARMAGSGEVDIIMKGKVNTADLIRAVLDREVGLRTGRLLSNTVACEVPGFNRLIVLTDPSINIAPTLPQKAEMIENAVSTAQALGFREPKVAALAAFELVNPDMPATVDAAGLATMARRGQIKGALVEGPIALDLAVSEWAAAQKGFQSPVSGSADIFLCPDLVAANIMLRCIIYFAQGKVGGVIRGAKVPVVLLSRAEPAETKVNSVALAVLITKANRE